MKLIKADKPGHVTVRVFGPTELMFSSQLRSYNSSDAFGAIMLNKSNANFLTHWLIY